MILKIISFLTGILAFKVALYYPKKENPSSASRGIRMFALISLGLISAFLIIMALFVPLPNL